MTSPVISDLEGQDLPIQDLPSLMDPSKVYNALIKSKWVAMCLIAKVCVFACVSVYVCVCVCVCMSVWVLYDLHDKYIQFWEPDTSILILDLLWFVTTIIFGLSLHKFLFGLFIDSTVILIQMHNVHRMTLDIGMVDSS